MKSRSDLFQHDGDKTKVQQFTIIYYQTTIIVVT